MDEVLRIEPEEILFPLRFGELSTTICQYTNLHHAPVAYNVRTTRPDHYCVQLNRDIIQPGETKSVVFVRKAQDILPQDLTCRDRFQVLVRKLDSPELAAQSIDELWSERKKHDFDRKYRVKLAIDETQPRALDDASRKSASAKSVMESSRSTDVDVPPRFPPAAPRLPPSPSGVEQGMESKPSPVASEVLATLSSQTLNDSLLHLRPFSVPDSDESASERPHSNVHRPVDINSSNIVVEPEVENTSVTVSAATARFRGEEQRKHSQLPQRGERAAPPATNAGRRRTVAEYDAAPSNGAPHIDSSTARPSSIGDVDQPATATANEQEVERSKHDESKRREEEEQRLAEQKRREEEERRRVAEEEEKRRAEEEKRRAEEEAKRRAEEEVRIAREKELLRQYTREQVVRARGAPRVELPVLDASREQRAAVDRSCALYRMIAQREEEIEKLSRELFEAKHKLSNARIGVAPLYELVYETDDSTRIPLAQIAVMAALSGALLTLFL